MKVTIFYAFLYSLLILYIILPSSSAGYQHKSATVRKERSIKDAYSKDGFSETPAVAFLRHKVFSLDGSMEKLTGEIEQLSEQNIELQESMLEQKGLIEKMADGFAGLQQQLSANAERLNDFEKLTGQSATPFAFSNHTCGGELVAQSGAIMFSTRSYYAASLPSSCVWTVRANNRESIKVSTFSTLSSYAINTYVLEIVRPNGTTPSTNGSQPFQIKITKLQKNMPHIFSGPTIFIVTSLINTAVTDVYLDLHWDGLGALLSKDTFFTHETRPANLTQFNSNELTTWNSTFLEKMDANYTLDFTTIVISNFSTKSYLQAAIGYGGCSNGESFIVISQMMENGSLTTDCCKTNCEGLNSLMNFGSSYVILITKKFKAPMTFNLTWVADPKYPASIFSSPPNECGGVVGGISGTISYKSYTNYRSNERCVWVIVPQPLPRSSIVISFNAYGITDPDDRLYMMELTDANGNELFNSPNITILRRLYSYSSNQYTSQSREVYIIFYSDSAVVGDGFSLSWRATGDHIKRGSEITTQFSHYRSDNGSATAVSRTATFTASLYQVFIFTPFLPPTYSDGMQLELNQTLPVVGGNDCVLNELSVYIPVNGILSKTALACNDAGKAILQNADGMVVAVMRSQNVSLKEIGIDFNWERVQDEQRTEVTVEDNKCGGLINADNGFLKYKSGTSYLNLERCIWLLNAPTGQNISFKLAQDGFGEGLDYILLTTIDPETGTLRNDTAKINRASRSQTMNGSMVAIVFRSDSAYTGTGFTLRFFSRGFKSDAEKSYKSEFRHISETHGAVDFNEEEGTYDILVIASSVARRLNGPTANPIGIDWKGGLFKKANDSCTYDTIRFYEPRIYSNGGWELQAQFPNQTESTCEGVISILEEKEFFSSDSPTFLVIYKPVASGDSDDEETRKRFEFTYHTVAMHSSCGGTLRGENGRISYKESQNYINGERCIWEIEIPHAASIAFYLERSGVEACCDFVTVISESGLTEVRLSLTNRTTIISGSKARVRFSSDSSVTGTGFRLRYENSTDLVVQDNKCGGILRGDKGTLIYKRGIEYFNNEKCIYFLHSPQSTNITLQLVDDGFEACCDYLLVNTIDPITGTLRNDTVKINRAKRTHSFEESLLVLVFSSDGGTRGRGFSLKFSGTGNNSNPEYSYKLIHTFETEGTVSFPSSVWGRAANQSETKEIFVLAHSLSIVPGEDLSTMPTNISWTSGVFKKKNDSCDYGSVTFYTFPSQTGWTTEDQYPDANDTASCTDFITVPAKRNIWSANLTAFLVIYKPIEFEQIEENTTQFSFAFEKSARCGGVYIANSSYISYKENGYYANNEECIFLVEVPSAETIAFNLEKNGFEVCCDYISISSVDPFTGIQAPAVIISANNQTATVKGPVAIVTFTSDDSVAKGGFRLQFRMGRQMSDNAPYSYHLAHLNQPRLNHYSYEAQPNQVAIVAFSPESHRRIGRGTGFNITSFRPQVNESCYSDSFLVYNVYGRINNTVSLVKSFTASNVVHDQTFISENTARNCTLLGDSQFNPCDSIENCIDTPIGNIFRTNSSSFVAIYSTVNATSSLRFRGVAFTSGSYIR